MDTSELALVFFSILAQLAVGSFLVLGIVNWLASRKVGPEKAEELTGRGWRIILAVAVLALLVSLTHLGHPINAVLAVIRWHSAWLSREIVCVVLFTGFLAAFVYARWKNLGSPPVRRAFAALAGVFGVLLLFSMSMLYMGIRTQPAWATPFTPLSFINTAILLGTLGAGAILAATTDRARQAGELEGSGALLRQSLRGLALGAIVFVGLELVMLPLHLLNLAGDPVGMLTVKAIFSELTGVFFLRLVLAVVGGVVLSALAYAELRENRRTPLALKLMATAFALVLVAEWLGRFVFYMSNVRVGV